MAKAYDTFVESSDVNVTAHAPSGANAGAGAWSYVNGGQVNVIGATDLATDVNTGSGNRVRLGDDLGFDEMDVSAVFTSTGTTGEFVGFGLMARLAASGTATAIEFGYEFSTGANGSWVLSDGAANNALNEVFPGGSLTLRLQIRAGDFRGFVNGVQKVQLASNAFTGNTRAGLMLGNFTGGAGSRSTIDNYQSEGLVTVAGRNPQGMFFG